MSIQDTVKEIKKLEEDGLYEKALRVLSEIKFSEHEDWRQPNNVFYPRREGKYLFWEKMLFRPSHTNQIIRCFICPKCESERTIGAPFYNHEGLLQAAMLDEDCFYCNSDKFESMIIDIVLENLPNG